MLANTIQHLSTNCVWCLQSKMYNRDMCKEYNNKILMMIKTEILNKLVLLFENYSKYKLCFFS